PRLGDAAERDRCCAGLADCRGQIAFAQGNLDVAITAFQRSLELDPDPAAYLRLARVYDRMRSATANGAEVREFFRRAEEMLGMAEALDPEGELTVDVRSFRAQLGSPSSGPNPEALRDRSAHVPAERRLTARAGRLSGAHRPRNRPHRHVRVTMNEQRSCDEADLRSDGRAKIVNDILFRPQDPELADALRAMFSPVATPAIFKLSSLPLSHHAPRLAPL